MKNISSKVWSNIFFIIPAIFSAYYHLWFHSMLILLLTVFSTLYHISHEKKFYLYDKFFAYTLIFYNLYVLVLEKVSIEYFSFIFLFVIIGFYYFTIRKKDDIEWHLSSAIITLLVLLSRRI